MVIAAESMEDSIHLFKVKMGIYKKMDPRLYMYDKVVPVWRDFYIADCCSDCWSINPTVVNIAEGIVCSSFHAG